MTEPNPTENQDGSSTAKSTEQPQAEDPIHELFGIHDAQRDGEEYRHGPEYPAPQGGPVLGTDTSTTATLPTTRWTAIRSVIGMAVVGAITAAALGIGTQGGNQLVPFFAGLLVGLTGVVLGFAELYRQRS